MCLITSLFCVCYQVQPVFIWLVCYNIYDATYSIGAILLDLEDPTRIIGQLREPLLSPDHDEQDGYVPNVVYSCGALLHGDTLVIPYGIGDSSIGVATVPLDQLLASLIPIPD